MVRPPPVATAIVLPSKANAILSASNQGGGGPASSLPLATSQSFTSVSVFKPRDGLWYNTASTFPSGDRRDRKTRDPGFPSAPNERTIFPFATFQIKTPASWRQRSTVTSVLPPSVKNRS